MEIRDSVIWIALTVLLIVFPTIGYQIGVIKERRDYTTGFVQQVEKAYWDGFWDGYTKGKKEERVEP